MRLRTDVFFDTNILVYAAAPEDRRGEIALLVLAQGGVISVQVLNEFAVAARRRFLWAWPETAAALRMLRSLCKPPGAITLATHEKAFGIALHTGFHFYDSLIIAAALEARCTTLLSEDMQHARMIEDRLTIRKPFLA